jgi:DNA polymerase-3 subunit alpha
MKLSSYSFTQGFYRKPRISKSLLNKYHEGLICLSGCIKGEIAEKLLRESREAGLAALMFYKDLFGDDFYIELQDHGLPGELKVMPQLIELARETSTQMVLTNDCHYLNKKDSEAHDILLCIQTGKTISEPDRMQYPPNMYFKTAEEMKMLFPDIPEAFENTLKIAELVDFKLAYDSFLLPKVELPKNHANEAEFLKHLCFETAPSRYPNLTADIEKRINYELDVISNMGFAGYFLIVKDFIDAARERGVPVGPGRGSAAGSIISYLLGITQLDPLEYNLLFERFLNPERIEMPDIDIDFCAHGRSQVIDYVIEKYGRESVAQIITFGTLGAKSVIKDVARVMEVQPVEANKLTKLMPSTPKITLDDCLKQSNEFELAIQNNELYRTIFGYGRVIEGLIRQIGVHAAGVVIGPGSLSDYVPLSVSTQKDSESAVLVQFDGKWFGDLKLLKMDILGLKTLTVIKQTVDLVKKYKGIDVEIDKVDLADKKTYELFSTGQTDGLFQFESDGMKKYLRDLKPSKFEDLIAMVALYRPGPMQFIESFINRKYGREKVVYEHPLVEKTLRETYGVTVYQEQVMQIARDLGGLSGAEADTLRKAMSKKNVDMMSKLEDKFITGAKLNNANEDTVGNIWSNWLEFSKYAFNKSHAACYAYVAFQTAYLKAHYPVEFMTATLSCEEAPEKIPLFINVAQKMGIDILLPSVNTSDKDFKVIGNSILFGLNAIKNVGSVAVAAMVSEREQNGEYADFFDFVQRIDSTSLNKAVLESLIMAGAMDTLPGNRAQKFKAIEHALSVASIQQSDKKRGQFTLFDFMSDEEKVDSSLKLPEIDEWNDKLKLENEKNVLGFYISGHPLMEYEYLIKLFANVNTREASIENNQIPDKLRIIGHVNSVTQKRDKKGSIYLLVHLEDMYGRFEVTLFNQPLERFRAYAESGRKLLIIGHQSTFQGNTNDMTLKIMPQTIIPMEEIHKIKGELSIYMQEDKATEEFAKYMIEYCANNPGHVRINCIVSTDKFDKLLIQPSKLAMKLSESIVKELDVVWGMETVFVLEA